MEVETVSQEDVLKDQNMDDLIENYNLTEKEITDNDIQKELDWLLEQDNQLNNEQESPIANLDTTPQSNVNMETKNEINAYNNGYITSQDVVDGGDEVEEKGTQETEISKYNHIDSDEQQSDSDINHDDDDYTLTDDQRNAMKELDIMKQEMDYPYDDTPLEYDVRERLIQLNAEVANEPDPPEDRQHKVGFKDDLVDLVVPPSDHSDIEDEGASGDGTNVTSEPQSDSSLPTQEKSEDLNIQNLSINDNNENPDSPKSEGDPQKKVLIEKSGRFELVSADQVEADDSGFGLSPELEKQGEITVEEDNSQQMFAPSPPSQPRPATATGYSHRVAARQPQRAQSANASSRGQREVDSYAEHYCSPYGLTQQQKEFKKQREKLLAESKKREEEKRREEDREKREENEAAFQAWLNNKRKEIEQSRRKELNSQTDDDSSKQKEEEAKQAYEDWLKEKKRTQKQEHEIERQRQAELQSMYFIRERNECDKAYKQWLRKKRAEKQKEIQMARQKARIHSLASRRSRKSQALASAIRQAQAFRYVDYYGYRF